jgi:hypothetical protein
VKDGGGNDLLKVKPLLEMVGKKLEEELGRHPATPEARTKKGA